MGKLGMWFFVLIVLLVAFVALGGEDELDIKPGDTLVINDSKALLTYSPGFDGRLAPPRNSIPLEVGEEVKVTSRYDDWYLAEEMHIIWGSTMWVRVYYRGCGCAGWMMTDYLQSSGGG